MYLLVNFKQSCCFVHFLWLNLVQVELIVENQNEGLYSLEKIVKLTYNYNEALGRLFFSDTELKIILRNELGKGSFDKSIAKDLRLNENGIKYFRVYFEDWVTHQNVSQL